MKFIKLTIVNGKIPVIVNVEKIAYYQSRVNSAPGSFIETGSGSEDSGISVIETVDEITELIHGKPSSRTWSVV